MLRNRWPISVGTGGRFEPEQPADFAGITRIDSFEGIEISAIFEEFKYLFEIGISNIKKAAVVTDKKWVKKIVSIEDKIFKNTEMKCFSIDEQELAIKFLKNV